MIFDISQEIFSSDVYPGDTIPNKKEISDVQIDQAFDSNMDNDELPF